MDFLNTPNFKVMQKSLDVLWQKMDVVAQNIANVDTPHYKAKKLEFETILQQKLETINNSYALRMRYAKQSRQSEQNGNGNQKNQTLENLIDSVSPQIYRDNSTETRVDGNNVDIDHENLELARTKLQYDYMVRKITDEYNLLRHAVTEGRG